MANTERLDLLKVPSDPAEQEITNFNTETMMNENWEKIDAKVAVLGPDGKIPSDQIDIDTSDLATKQEVQDVDEKVDAHSADYMYQIPTIVGTQIRINRLSDTNRLFFKMENDLTGDITISTDGGTTEKTLVDFDQTQITQLEKGFVEVVAEADFFILRNRGISSADKQALIDIVNEAERNESDLKTQFINKVNDVDTDGEIDLPADATWAEVLANVSNIKTGKNWYGGYLEGSLPAHSQHTISTLGFVPKIIGINYAYMYQGGDRVAMAYASYNKHKQTWETIKDNSNAPLVILEPVNDGFTISVANNNSAKQIYWTAFE